MGEHIEPVFERGSALFYPQLTVGQSSDRHLLIESPAGRGYESIDRSYNCKRKQQEHKPVFAEKRVI